ncbi:MAG TPA: porin [Vicinamibacterales bacterium]|nr:porin [Vicinamibacterales bacterium]
MILRRFIPLLALSALTLAAASPALAQSQQPPATPTPQPSPTPAPPRIVAGQDGFAIESANGDFRLQFGMLAHLDGRFALGDENEQVVDTFAVRRARAYLRGRVSRRFEFYLNPDFAGGTFTLQDAYVDTVFSPAFRIRAGKAKTPFGFERLLSVSNSLFLERAFPTAIAPNRDIGVQILGDISGGLISYLAGVTNGVADGASSDTETNDSKDVSGRIVLRPFAKRAPTHPGRGVALGLSGTRGRATGAGALPTFKTQTLQQTFFTYAAGATPAVADGIRTRYSPSVWYLRGPFGGWGEYVHSEVPVRRGSVVQDVAHDAWQVAASWVLTGEAATDASTGVRPKHNFDFGNGHWGAFQVSARYHVLEIDDKAFTFGLAAAGSSRKAEAWTVGLRWYLNGNVWYTVNFERTVFDGNSKGPRRAENGLAFRTQLYF